MNRYARPLFNLAEHLQKDQTLRLIENIFPITTVSIQYFLRRRRRFDPPPHLIFLNVKKKINTISNSIKGTLYWYNKNWT